MKSVLERARAMARGMGHATAGDAHVLMALLEELPVKARMAQRAQSRARIERRLREMLAAEWDGRTYRAAPEPRLEAGLEDTIANVRSRGISGFFRAAETTDVFEHLVARRGLGAHLAFDDAAVRALFDTAARAMRSWKHWNLLIDHAFYELAARRGDDGRFARALQHVGHAPDEVYAALHRQLDAIGSRVSGKVAPWPALLTRAVAHANVVGREDLDVDVLIVDFLKGPFGRTCLSRIGISRDELLRAYVAGDGAVSGALPIPGPAEVIFRNDPFTKAEVVTHLLEGHFGKSSQESLALMLRVHEEGQASFSVPDAKVAGFLVEAALASCAVLGMPLRIELRAIPVGGKGTGGSPSF